MAYYKHNKRKIHVIQNNNNNDDNDDNNDNHDKISTFKKVQVQLQPQPIVWSIPTTPLHSCILSTTNIVVSSVPQLETSLNTNLFINLNQRKESVISALYPNKLQCKICGLRFHTNNNNDISVTHHYDWHFKMKQREQRCKKELLSQQWFMTEDEWTKHTDPLFNDLINSKPFEVEIKQSANTIQNIPANNDQPRCPICNEKFDTYFDQEEELWMYTDTQKDLTSGYIVHTFCFSSISSSVSS
jgi:hypothetical protein